MRRSFATDPFWISVCMRKIWWSFLSVWRTMEGDRTRYPQTMRPLIMRPLVDASLERCVHYMSRPWTLCPHSFGQPDLVLHCKKSLTVFPSTAGMSLTKPQVGSYPLSGRTTTPQRKISCLESWHWCNIPSLPAASMIFIWWKLKMNYHTAYPNWDSRCCLPFFFVFLHMCSNNCFHLIVKILYITNL